MNVLQAKNDMKIYIASFFDTKERILPYAARIQELGFELTSTWLKETHKDEKCPQLTEGLMSFYGWRDYRELNHTDLMILDTFDQTHRGGREFEFGYVYSRGVPVWLVGPVRNVFHRLIEVKLANWDEVIQCLEEKTRALYYEG